MTTLYLLRHGRAVDPYAWPDSDETRPLTELGISACETFFESLRTDGTFQIEAIWSSPYLRTMQTATLAGDLWGAKVSVRRFLASGARPESILAALQQAPHPDPLLLVGHAPDLNGLCLLLAQRGSPPVSLSPGTMVKLSGELEPGIMQVEWVRSR